MSQTITNTYRHSLVSGGLASASAVCVCRQRVLKGAGHLAAAGRVCRDVRFQRGETSSSDSSPVSVNRLSGCCAAAGAGRPDGAHAEPA